MQHEGAFLDVDASPFYELMPAWFLPVGIIVKIHGYHHRQPGSDNRLFLSLVNEATKLSCGQILSSVSQHHQGQIYLPAINWFLYAGCRRSSPYSKVQQYGSGIRPDHYHRYADDHPAAGHPAYPASQTQDHCYHLPPHLLVYGRCLSRINLLKLSHGLVHRHGGNCHILRHLAVFIRDESYAVSTLTTWAGSFYRYAARPYGR